MINLPIYSSLLLASTRSLIEASPPILRSRADPTSVLGESLEDNAGRLPRLDLEDVRVLVAELYGEGICPNRQKDFFPVIIREIDEKKSPCS